MNTDEQKRAVAAAAVDWIAPLLSADVVVGVGTGSTADHFIDLLAARRGTFAGAVASSRRSAERLEALGVRVFDLNDVDRLPVYVDGADEIAPDLAMTKGGGGALTCEKIVAAAADTFVCMADASKRVPTLGRFPVPVEVIGMARERVVRALVALGRDAGLGDATVTLRRTPDGVPYVTDNGQCIVDVADWSIADPRRIETAIGTLVGVVECGLFAHRPADVLLVAGDHGVEEVRRAR